MANVRIGVSSTGLASTDRRVRRLSSSFRGMGRAGLSATRSLTGGFGRLRSTLGGMRGVIGGLGIAIGARQILQFDDALGALQAASGRSTDSMRALRDNVLGIQSAYAISKDQVLEAAQVFQDQGGILEQNERGLAGLAKAAKATGSDMRDLAVISAALQNNLDQSPEGALKIITGLIAQGDAGTIAMKQMAKEMKPIAGLAGATSQSILTLGAAFQTIGRQAKSPETAREQLTALLTALQKQSPKLKKLGVRVFEPDGKTLRQVDDVLKELFLKTGGKLEGKRGLQALLPDTNALKAAQALLKDFDLETGRFRTGKGKFGALKTAKGGDSLIDRKLRLLTGGISAESEKIKKAALGLESTFQRLGKSALGFAASNPITAGVIGAGGLLGGQVASTAIGGALAARFMGRGGGAGAAGGGMAQMGLPLGGGPAPMGRFASGLSRATSALGALTAADVLAELGTRAAGEAFLFVQKKLNEQELKARTTQINANQLALVAQQLQQLRSRGQGVVTGPEGKQTALDAAGITAILEENARRIGTDTAQIPALVAKALADAPIIVNIQAPGIDKAKAEVNRKPKIPLNGAF